jgi:hypothetical protein
MAESMKLAIFRTSVPSPLSEAKAPRELLGEGAQAKKKNYCTNKLFGRPDFSLITRNNVRGSESYREKHGRRLDSQREENIIVTRADHLRSVRFVELLKLRDCLIRR